MDPPRNEFNFEPIIWQPGSNQVLQQYKALVHEHALMCYAGCSCACPILWRSGASQLCRAGWCKNAWSRSASNKQTQGEANLLYTVDALSLYHHHVLQNQVDKAWLPTNIRLLDIRATHEDGHQGMLDSLCSLACCQAPAYMPLRCTARKCAMGSPTLSDRSGAGTLFSLAGNHLSLLICQFKSVERAG